MPSDEWHASCDWSEVRSADDRYLRTFYIPWTAVPGTHRVVGDRLSYEPICTLVVQVG